MSKSSTIAYRYLEFQRHQDLIEQEEVTLFPSVVHPYLMLFGFFSAFLPPLKKCCVQHVLYYHINIDKPRCEFILSAFVCTVLWIPFLHLSLVTSTGFILIEAYIVHECKGLRKRLNIQ